VTHSRTEPVVIEYYFSFISLWSYVGSLQFRSLTQTRQARVDFKPIDLMAVFAAGGGKPVKQRPLQRQAYRLVEMQRWRDIRGIPLVLEPRFYPADPSLAHRLLLAALERNLDVADFVHNGLKAVWADELNIEDTDTIVALACRSGLDGESLLQAAQNPSIRERQARLTQEAIDRQVFGAPFYFYRNEPFWGQDRLDLLASAIDSQRPPLPLPALAPQG
jgi:2-hydroxychromene-2-carboxylate isomerase